MKIIIVVFMAFAFSAAQTYTSPDGVTYDFSDRGVIKIDDQTYDASLELFSRFVSGNKILDAYSLSFTEYYKEVTLLVEAENAYFAVYLLMEGDSDFKPLDYIEIKKKNVKKIAFVEGDYVWVLHEPVYDPEGGGKITGYLLTQFIVHKKERTYGTIVDRVIRKHDPVFITDSADDFGLSADGTKIYIRYKDHYRWVRLQTPRSGRSLIGKDVEKDGYDRREYFYQLLETTPPDQGSLNEE